MREETSSLEQEQVRGRADRVRAQARPVRGIGSPPEDRRFGSNPFASARGTPFYRRIWKLVGLGVAEVRGLQQIEEENRNHATVADLRLDLKMLRDDIRTKL